MKVFITWSGKKSKAVALALREWIPDVLNNIEAWMSEIDIGAGRRWSEAIALELGVTNCGIICLTKSNLNQPWILFEAGALAKSISDDTYVCPYLIDLEPAEIPSGPLTQFQSKRTNKEETLQLMETLNNALGDLGVTNDRLHRNFNRCWPDLEEKIQAAVNIKEIEPESRSVDDMVAEILEIVRGIIRGEKKIGEKPKEIEDEGLQYYREPGGRGEWLTREEIEDRIGKDD